MPPEPIYTDSSLLKNRTTRGCPNPTDISGTNVHGVPVVYDPSLSLVKVCTRDMFKPDHNLANTQGCCVVDSSGEDCTDYTTEKETEDPFYDMGVVYFKTSESNKGQRKICYTTPIRKRRVKYMELLYEVFYKCCFLILIALQAACYEYWMIYGKCDIDNTIATTLTEIPYLINQYPDDKSVESSTSSTCDKSAKPNTKTINWYSTFPYNLITYINEPKKEKNTYDPRELVKIPIRGVLLGFFYCVIISRILMKAIIKWCSEKYNSLVESKNNNIFKGLFFVFVFMGLYGNIAYMAGYNTVPGINATASVLLGTFGAISIWFGCILGFFVTILSFLGYRKDLRTKYIEHQDDSDKPELNYWEKFVYYCGSEKIIEMFLDFKNYMEPNDEKEDILNLIEKKKITNKVLDWFFPIRLKELILVLPECLNIDLTKHWNAVKNNWGEEPPECRPGGGYFWRWVCNSWDGNNYELYTSPFNSGDGSTYKPRKIKETESADRIKKAEEKDYARKVLGYAMDAAIKQQESNPCGNWYRFILAIILGPAWFRLVCLGIYVAIIVGFWGIWFVLNFAWFLFVLYLGFTFITCGFFGNMIAVFYLHLYVIIGFFYAPISDYKKLLEIIKSHGNILTLLFCAIVLQTGVQVLDPISSGVIGGLLAILVAYKLIGALNV